jgi:hypothetical protein
VNNLDKSTILDFSFNPKNVALYFENIIPLYHDVNYPFQSLSPNFLMDKERNDELIPDYFELFRTYYYSKAAAVFKDGNADLKLDNFINYVAQFIQKYHLQKIPIILMPLDELDSSSTNENIVLKLANLQLVDISNTSWEHILEFRKDEKAKTSLRKLILFFHKNYIGKSKTFIEDDLNNLLEDYKNSVKDWGFETKTSTISMLLSSKTLLGTIGATITSVFLNVPSIAVLTAGAGVSLEIGNITLHILKRKYELSKLRRNHPLSYIIDAQKNLKDKC